jgi:hypothetical protein
MSEQFKNTDGIAKSRANTVFAIERHKPIVDYFGFWIRHNPNHSYLGRVMAGCPTPNKYPRSKSSAENAIIIERKKRGRRFRAYLCKCGKYHLTTQRTK